MRREADAGMEIIALPIMTFDERSFAPAFGYVFNRKWLDPHESIISILWKFARMNALPGHLIIAQLAKSSVDSYEGVAASRAEVDMRRLRSALGVHLKIVRGALIPDWLRDRSSPHFRYCAKCLRRGYHGVVHQLNGVAECPIHCEALQVACPSCGRSTPYVLNVQLLDAPFRCSDCRAYFGLSGPQFLKRSPLKLWQRVAVTRLKLHYYSM